ETPQEHKRRGGSPAARGKGSLARKSTAVSHASHTNSFLPFIRLLSPPHFYSVLAFLLRDSKFFQLAPEVLQ
ncbi:hypothetical protein, partial [Priestia megaterium]|uniref:hypothetical protein n=1 Tax=Priestia megaterium TaxID=1404 RepID=UPI002E240487|nr:hypothetical protein [Priestia megaterium]